MNATFFKLTVFAGITSCFLSFDLPNGWIAAGSHPKKYDMGIDKGAGQDGKNAATIKSNSAKIKGFGTLMQDIIPDNYLGKRIRMTGLVKTKDVADWAGLWIRVDRFNSADPLAFDNMYDRSIKGTNDWKKYEIVVDVPLNASNIAFGAMLSGTGQIWFDNLSFEVVEKNIPLTGTYRDYTFPLAEPVNLNFETE